MSFHTAPYGFQYGSVWEVAREGPTRRLSREDWTAAALGALEQGGLPAVAIEPLAARLGATKGSGYWHFANRADLVTATLERWEQDHTAAVIAQIDRGGPPGERLRDLLYLVMGHPGPDTVELALLASVEHPQVAAALQRVTERRIAYLSSLFREMGFDVDESRRRALLAYSTFLGHIQLARTAPAAVLSGPERDAYLESLLAALTRGAS